MRERPKVLAFEGVSRNRGVDREELPGRGNSVWEEKPRKSTKVTGGYSVVQLLQARLLP